MKTVGLSRVVIVCVLAFVAMALPMSAFASEPVAGGAGVVSADYVAGQIASSTYQTGTMPIPSSPLIVSSAVISEGFVVAAWVVGALVLFLALPIGWSIGKKLLSAARSMGKG